MKNLSWKKTCFLVSEEESRKIKILHCDRSSVLKERYFFISQSIYVLDLLKEITKIDCKTIGDLVKQNHRIWYDEGSTMNKDHYQTYGEVELHSLLHIWHNLCCKSIYPLPKGETFTCCELNPSIFEGYYCSREMKNLKWRFILMSHARGEW